MARRILSFAALLGLIFPFAASAHADSVVLNPSHPQRYTVVRGDTLWGISARFLKDPWQWAKVWTINPQIKNPNLIYPGDVIALSYVNGEPRLTLLRTETLAPVPGSKQALTVPGTPAARTTAGAAGVTALTVVKLEPKLRSEPINQAIPTISPTAIGPFLTRPLVVSRDQLHRDPYIAEGLDSHVVLGTASRFYARGLGPHPARYYEIFRRGEALREPGSGKTLGYQAQYLGRAKLLRGGDPARLVVTAARQEIFPGDRLVAASRVQPPEPYYFPHPPGRMVHGRIISALNNVADFGPLTVVAIDLGRNDGMRDGDVLRILHPGRRRVDPVTGDRYRTPDEPAGLLMVFRVFGKVSYALIMSASGPIDMYDKVMTP